MKKRYKPWEKDTGYSTKKSWKKTAMKWGLRIGIPLALVAYDYARTETVNAKIYEASPVGYNIDNMLVQTDEGIFRNDKELLTFKGRNRTEDLQSTARAYSGQTVKITYNGWDFLGMRPNIRRISPIAEGYRPEAMPQQDQTELPVQQK